MAADPTRRALLASAVGLPLLLTACKGVQVLGSPPPPSADVEALQAAITAEDSMVRSYTAALAGAASGQAAAAQLTVVLAEHREHLAQLHGRLIETSERRAASPVQPGKSVIGGAASLAAALAGLERAELAASGRLIGELGGLPSSLAQLFASVAASEATHVPLLRSLGRHA